MRQGLSPRERRILFLGVPVAIAGLWAYLVMLIGPLGRELKDMQQEMATVRQKLQVTEAATTHERVIQQQYENLRRKVSLMKAALPAEDQVSSMIELLSDLASQTQVRVQTITPKRAYANRAVDLDVAGADTRPVVYKTIPIQIDARSGYHEFGVFLSLLEASDLPMKVSTLRIISTLREPEHHDMRLLIETYVALEEDPAETSIQ